MKIVNKYDLDKDIETHYIEILKLIEYIDNMYREGNDKIADICYSCILDDISKENKK